MIKSSSKLMTPRLIIMLATLVSATFAQQEGQGQSEGLLTVSQIWGFGFLACLGVSLLGFLAAGFLVCIKKVGTPTCFDYLVRFLFALSCGALLGDAAIHILSEAYSSQDTQGWLVSLVFICSIAFFLILERLFHAFGITHTHWHGEGDQHSHHSQNNQMRPDLVPITVMPAVDSSSLSQLIINETADKKKSKHVPQENKGVGNQESINNGQIRQMQGNEGGENPENKQIQGEKSCCGSLKGKESAGYLNLVGSLIHNFIDGLALGVAFATGDRTQFIPLLIAIVAHEIPRELGDVAVLLKSNFNEIQTILCNGIVNLVSILGGIIGLAIIDLNSATQTYILVFVAGNFVFVAADIWRHILKSKTWMGNLLESFGFALGVAIMFGVLFLESS